MADNFGLSGPTHITAVDWNNSNHRRSIAASLVQGVYVLEAGRLDPTVAHLASPWWEAFNFRVSQLLVDPHDQSYFGAIYDYVTPSFAHQQVGPQSPPRHVIAFRGKIPKPGSSSKADDFKVNIQCLLGNLEETPRFQVALENVSRVVSGPGTVWLAGHSLGSSMALVIGRNTARQMSIHLESYLFNPPFASLPIKNEKLKTGLRFANTVITAGLAKVAASKNGAKAHESDSFSALGSWIPYLFVNQGDSVCSEYIGYFEHREKLESFGVGKIGKLATKHSIGSIVSTVRGKDTTEAVHLIPSAYLTVNCTPCYNYREAHAIHQWWKPDLELKYKLYQFK